MTKKFLDASGYMEKYLKRFFIAMGIKCGDFYVNLFT